MDDVLSVLRRSPLFGLADERELPAIAARLRSETFADGTTVIREGETGTTCHVIRAGRAAVVTSDLIQQEVALAELGPGDTFGELALIAGRPRSATVLARGDLVTLVLDRAAFEALAATCPGFAGRAREHLARLDLDAFLKRGSPFARLPADVIDRIGRALRTEDVPAGALVFAEGDPPDAFRVVRSGRLEAVRGRARLQTYGVGDCFGEVALLTGGPRNAMVRAIEPSEVVALDREDFTRLVQEEPAFARLVWELSGIRGARVSERDRVTADEAEAALPALQVGRRARWPWVFGIGTVLFGALTLAATRGGPPMLLDAAVIAGALVGPVTFVTYLVESDLIPERPLRVVATFAGAGMIAVPVSGVIEAALRLRLGTIGGVLGIAVVEEVVKLLVLAPLAFQRTLRFRRDGIVYGGAAGMGFAAFETFLYGRAALAAGGDVLTLIWMRALLSPFGHGTWTAIAAAGLFSSKGSGGRPRLDAAVAAAVATSVGLHALWNWMPLPGPLGLLWFGALGILGIWLLLGSADRAVSESARSALALNPELAGAAAGVRARCENCGQLSLAGSHYCVRCGAALRVEAADARLKQD